MSRIDKLKEQHPDLNVSVIDLLAKVDPTDSYKYTEFLIKRMKEWFGGNTTEKTQIAMGIELIGESNVKILNEFEIHSKAGRIKKNDIGQYKDFRTLSSSVKEAEEILKQKEAEKQTIKLMDTNDYCIIIPLSYEASKIYGSGTKWCTTQERHWNDYKDKYKLIYIIQKTTNKKYAISRKKGDDTKIQAWLDNDNEISPFLLPLPTEVMTIITNEVKKNECVKDLIKTDESISLKTNSNGILNYISQYVTTSDFTNSNSYLDYHTLDILSRYTQDMLGTYQHYERADTGLVEEREIIDNDDVF
jgi:hypothetical protein